MIASRLFARAVRLAVLLLLVPAVAHAQEAAPAIDKADTAWLLVCSALVLFMTLPGLALFYGGLVRRRNVLGTMMHSFGIAGVATLVWICWGYSLAFGGGAPAALAPFIGGLDKVFLQNVTVSSVADGLAVPETAFLLFQGMFAIITPALITGAYAERIKFSAMVLFSALWLTFVYCPLAHMVWGGGWLAAGNEEGLARGLDFAGGTVVHISSGISALVCALVLGKRRDWPSAAVVPHSVVLSLMGACMLWVGWFGFNAGSQLAVDGNASMAFLVTHIAAASGAIGWAAVERIHRGKAGALGAITGAVAGLVAITPASGFVLPMPAILIGAAAGLMCYLFVALVKNALRYDDSLDAFGVHGIGGIVGALLTGVFATRAVLPIFGEGAPVGAIDGNPGQIWDQTLAVIVTIVLAAGGTWVLLQVTRLVTGLRLTPEEEVQGLDLSQHGEEGYNYET